MGPYLESVTNVMLDRSPEEWIGGIIVALVLSLALSGAYMACRRWAKDETMPLVCLAIVANFAGMVVAAGYVQLKSKGGVGIAPTDAARPEMRRPRGQFSFAPILANRIFEGADANGDGSLSTDEAAVAAAKFVAETAPNGEGAIDREVLTNALRERMRPPGGAPPPNMMPAPEPRPSS